MRLHLQEREAGVHVVYGFIEAPTQGWTSPAVWGALVACVVASIAFVVVELRVRSPMLPLSMLRIGNFGGANLLTLSYNGLRGKNFMNFVRGGPGFGGYAAVFVADDRVKTWYDAMQVQLQRPFTGENRWGGGLAYTLSKSTEQGKSQDLFWGFDDRHVAIVK